MITNIVITGVGGQGIIFIAHVLAEAAHQSGLQVYVGEVHGMAQRGGTVLSYVRIGDAHSSLVAPGEAQILLGMEIGETLRARKYITAESWVLSSTRKIIPMSVIAGQARYPIVDKIEKSLKELSPYVKVVDAPALAQKCGSEIAENTVMLGTLVATGVLPVDKKVVRDILAAKVKEKWREVNLAAFAEGLQQR